LAITANESFPLGLAMGISESTELYEGFFSAMWDVMRRNGIERDVLKDKPYLSDRHAALISACSGMTHFYCPRHLVQKFGAHTYLGQIAKRLAFS
jgi:hypothetical protein